MWRSKKFIVIAVLATLPLIVLMLIGEGSTQVGDSDASQTETETAVNEKPDRMQPQMHLAEVAEILGINQQELENAFTQARDELGDGGLPASPRERPPDGPPPDGSPPATEPLPEALLAKMAEILGIEQQKLEDAFAQARSEITGRSSAGETI